VSVERGARWTLRPVLEGTAVVHRIALDPRPLWLKLLAGRVDLARRHSRHMKTVFAALDKRLASPRGARGARPPPPPPSARPPTPGRAWARDRRARWPDAPPVFSGAGGARSRPCGRRRSRTWWRPSARACPRPASRGALR